MAAEVPKISPYMLESGLEMCPRRLLFEHEGRAKTAEPFNRWRIREPFVEAAGLAHATLRAPAPQDFPLPRDLVAEEEVLWGRAVEGYLRHFGGPALDRTDDALAAPTISPSRNVRLAGGVDLLVEDAEGELELRQLELWRRPTCADPLQSFAVAVAVLRLARSASGLRIRIIHADLLSESLDRCEFDYATQFEAVRDRFDARLDALRAHMDRDRVLPGIDCGSCGFIAGCPPHAQAS